MNTLLLVDGNALMHRAFHAIPPFKTKDGVPTNVVYGFFSMLDKSIHDFDPSHVIVCFDTPTPTFRKKMFAEYQAHRPKAADEFKSQIPLVKNALDAGSIVHMEKQGFEGDDVIGTITQKFAVNGKVLILTGDKDILQLVNDSVFVISPQATLSHLHLMNSDDVVKKFNVTPSQIPDYKALVGDPSDNYKGAKGIGPKTAAKLIHTYETIDKLLNNVEKLDGKVKALIKEHQEHILMSKQLATIDTHVAIDVDFQKAKFEGFQPALKEYLLKLEMYNLASRLFKEKKTPEKEKPETLKKDTNQIGLF